MNYAIGIDLGTCNSAVTHVNDSGKSEIIVNSDGQSLTPSVVNFDRIGNMYVGQSAQRMIDNDPKNTAHRFKRHMGTKKSFLVAERHYDATQLSAFVLEKLTADAKAELSARGSEARISRAIITVPAEFTDSARSATIDAARSAGIEVDDLLDEPTAAIVYHQHCQKGRSSVNGVYAVVDVGGGTTDISIVDVNGTKFEVRCSKGSVKVGGIDFDRMIYMFIREKFDNKYPSHIFDERVFSLAKAEDLKKVLSERSYAPVDVSGTDSAGSAMVRDTFEISRDDFERSIGEYVQEIGQMCSEAMEEASISPDDIRDVLLVGGSVRIPAVKRKIDEVFESNSIRTKDCDEAVSRGAGLYALSRCKDDVEIPLSAMQKEAVQEIDVSEVLHKSYGIIVLDEELDTRIVEYMFHRGEKVPRTIEKPFDLKRKTNSSSTTDRRVLWTIVECDDDSKDPNSKSCRTRLKVELVIPLKAGSKDPFGPRKLTAKFHCNMSKVLMCEFVDVLTREKSVSKPILLDQIDDGGHP